MSWFSEITGKAESFLNAMDQGAAKALSSTRKSSRQTNDWQVSDDVSEVSYTPSSLKTSSSSASISIITNNGNGSNNGKSQPSSKGHTRASSFESIGSNISKTAQPDDDERLFEFLNSKISTEIQEETDSKIVNDDDIKVLSQEKAKDFHESTEFEDLHSSTSTTTDVVIDYQGKIKSLSLEIASLNRRNIELETECKRLQKRITNWQSQLTSSDQTIRELEARENDLRQSLDAKDSQIGVLKVRLKEVDDELQMKIEQINELKLLNESLRKESENEVTSANVNIEEYKQKIRVLEDELEKEKDELRRVQAESMGQIARLEENQRSLVDEIAIAQRNLATEKGLNVQLEQKLHLIKRNFENLEKEFSEYKLKATKTLQDKDDLIKALKNNQQGNEDAESEIQRVLQSQCDAMVLEMKDLRDKNEYLKKQLDHLQNDELPSLSFKVQNLAEELESERRLKVDLESELKQVTDESRYFQEDLQQTKTNLTSRITDRDAEIEKLRKQLVSKLRSNQNINGSQNIEEMETRIRNLTDNLIQKQTLVEQLTSDKHSLSLQLERSETRLRESLSSSAKTGEVSIGIHQSQSFSNLINRNINVKPLVEETPYDSQVTRRVKRAYGQIDAFSIRLGNFLRAYPSARAAVILYIILLHIWVAFVLFYYEPEVHGSNYNKMPTE